MATMEHVNFENFAKIIHVCLVNDFAISYKFEFEHFA